MANNVLSQSDSFAGGALAAGWSVWPSTAGLPAVVAGSPNVIQPTGTSTTDGVYWTGQVWPNDQIAECTINSLGAGGANVTLGVRIVGSGGNQSQGYQVIIQQGTANIGTVTNNSFASLKSVAVTAVAGDVWTFACIGRVLQVYQNSKRISYIHDETFVGGSPGVFVQSNSSLATSAQVSSVRLYSVQQSDGVWTKRGCILLGTATEMGGSPNGNAGLSVNYGSSVFLNPGGNCFRGYWAYRNGSTPNVAYAESLDGISWTRYSGNPVISGFGGGIITWIGATAYTWGQASPGSSAPHMFTSSDGVTWTDGGATSGLSVTNFACYAVFGVTKIASVYNGLLAGLSTLGNNAPVSFLVTSSDGITWTVQNSSNPVVTSFCGAALYKIGSTYYFPGTSNQPGQNATSSTAFDPQAAILYSSPDLTTWTKVGPIIQNSLINDSLNSPAGGIAAVTMINVSGTAYLYYQGSPGDSAGPQDYQCMLATAPGGVPWETVVQFSQTGLSQIASDAFTNGNGPLSANWTTAPWSVGALQIVTGPFVEANNATGARCAALYTGSSFPRNQYSQATIHALSGTAGSNFLELIVLGNNGAQQTGYYGQIGSPTGSLSNQMLIQKVVNGSATNLILGSPTTIEITPQVGDTFTFSNVVGNDGSNILTIYQNGIQVLQVQDYSPLTSGSPGMQINTVALANVQIATWSGGSTATLPAYPGGGADTQVSVSGCQPIGDELFITCMTQIGMEVD